MSLTPTQYDIINSFARGANPGDIARARGMTVPEINAILAKCGQDRSLARELLARDDGRPPTDPPAEPAPEPPATLEEVLAAGEKHTQPRIRSLARRARALVDDLADRIAKAAQHAEAEARIAQLKAELAQAEAALKPARRTPHRRVEAKVVRRWAAAASVPCPKAGRGPAGVVEAYLAAQEAHRG